MKKIVMFMSFALVALMAGCANQDLSNQVSNNLDTNSSLAFSTYLASGILNSNDGTTTNVNVSQIDGDANQVQFLTDSTIGEESTLKIETELDEVNVYFDKLKVFMDNGLESALNITEQTSTIEGYDQEITFSIDGETYTIYYSLLASDTTTDTDETANTDNDDVDDEDEEEDRDEEEFDEEDEDEDDEEEFELVGLMVIDGVEYELTGANEIEGNEQEMWFETKNVDNDENYVRVEIEEEAGEQKFEIETVIDGISKTAEIKFEQEEDETKVELKLDQNGIESEYEFKKELEEDEITYKFEYEIDGVEGEVKVKEVTDSEGNTTYHYEIEEDGENKEVDKRDPDDEDEDDEDESDDDSEEA